MKVKKSDAVDKVWVLYWGGVMVEKEQTMF